MDALLDGTRRDQPVSWPGVLLGILPFVLLGPAAVLLAYPWPPPAWRTAPPASTLISLLYLVPLVLGIAAGWARRWPLWSYPYLGPVLVIPGILAVNAITGLARYVSGLGVLLAVPLILAVFALMIAVVLLLVHWLGPLRGIAAGVRYDWTRLSFSLFLLVAMILGGIDHDEDPVLTAYVILPTLAITAAAVVYLRSRTQARRALALLAGLCLAVTIRMVDGKIFMIIYGVILAGIIFLPAIIKIAAPARSSPDLP